MNVSLSPDAGGASDGSSGGELFSVKALVMKFERDLVGGCTDSQKQMLGNGEEPPRWDIVEMYGCGC